MTTIETARSAYYLANDFGADGGLSDKWVVFKLGPIPFAIPNSDGRRKAVPYHDVHHILTGYETTWQGEFEISAFEVAVGCHNLWAAWVLNLAGMTAGAVLNPGPTWRAFVRGRQAAGLYAEPDLTPFLKRDVDDVRAELGLDAPLAPSKSEDKVAFARFFAVGVGMHVVALAMVAATIAAAWWALA